MAGGPSLYRLSETRKAWYDSQLFKAILYVGFSEIKDDKVSIEFQDNPDVGEPARLTFTKSRNVFHLNLTSLNEEELDLFKRFINQVIEEVRPTIQNLDQVSQSALESGKNVYIRSYRLPAVVQYRPNFVPRTDRGLCGHADDEREQPEHDQGLQERPSEAAPIPKRRVHPEDR